MVRSEMAAERGAVERITVVGREGVNADGELFPRPERTTWQWRDRVERDHAGRGVRSRSGLVGCRRRFESPLLSFLQ